MNAGEKICRCGLLHDTTMANIANIDLAEKFYVQRSFSGLSKYQTPYDTVGCKNLYLKIHIFLKFQLLQVL